MSPDELLYAKTHEWVHVSEEDGAKIATVGLSAFALEALTDLVYLQLPEVGAAVTAGESFGEVESVKAVSDLYSPVSGQVVAANTELSDDLEKLGADPYGAGWLAKIKISDEAALGELINKAAYDKQCAEEEI